MQVTSYKLYIDDGNGNFGAPITYNTLGTLQYTFTGLNDSVAYQFMVQAGNDIGYGPTSDTSTYYAADIPGAPAAPIFEGGTVTSISLAWSPPAYTGGIPITGYLLYMQVLEENILIYDGTA